jgi:isoleucyl-tRNA synthetase
VAPIDQNGVYEDGFGWLTGRNVLEVTEDLLGDLGRKGILHEVREYTHRYPTCWRCGTELAFRLVDEWFIAMDPLREPMMEAVRTVRWIPPYGLDRELDWLRNMGDWMISKKRYWGLALPFWLCPNNHLRVIGGRDELAESALDGLEHLESPHRPWIDDVHVRCLECDEVATRIPDVGNPWLDAGIVPYSTLGYTTDRTYWKEWFPAEFITESFPGQFRNWFYSMLAMSTVLENTAPFQTVLGYALLRDENGREMHKSWGNIIPFDEAADRVGADVMRWLFCLHNPEQNLNFGYHVLDDVKRKLMMLWNTYSFFVQYAVVDKWKPDGIVSELAHRPLLDKWIIARLHLTIASVRSGLDEFESAGPARAIEEFIEDLSTWYVRRSRRRFWRQENDEDKAAAYATLYECLTVLSRLLAPFTPFVSEAFYQNLVRCADPSSPVSIHLCDYPEANHALVDEELLTAMELAKRVVSLGRAARERANIKVRQPLASLYLKLPTGASNQIEQQVREIILEELNVRDLKLAGTDEEFVRYTVRPNLPALGPRFGKLLPQIRASLEALEPSTVAAAVEAGQNVRVPMNGKEIELAPSDVLVSAHEREGYAAMADAGYLVALDTQLTPELISEGMARDVVRRLNEWRKSAGLRIEDRIRVRYEATPGLAAAVASHADYIRRETLCVLIRREGMRAAGYHATAEFGGEKIEVEIETVDPAAGDVPAEESA